ncbi:hypothetical protein [Sphingomonas bacterium]|uniref:hypothetical protein n=1 Tax=Sphingomonas bacterium TaxID=1895847 RepID=UPI00262B2EAB|nr:hypothetical protein [Sphingomonas bacterium]MDB5678812.1 hypothetical protein [Sphingomonas bacterium]
MRSETRLALAAALALLAASPAAADDGRRHVMTPTQKIDLVRDLPNDETFERDGEYFDLGYIYPIHTVNGASVASDGGDAGFVLYHDDRYARLDANDLRTVTMALGEDPTAGYNPPVAASSGQPFSRDASRPGFAEPSASGTSAGLGVGAAFGWFFFLIIGAIAAVAGILRRLSRGAIALSQTGSGSYRAAIGNEPFEARVAARLAELQNGGAAVEPAVYDPGATPVARDFGRKGA